MHVEVKGLARDYHSGSLSGGRRVVSAGERPEHMSSRVLSKERRTINIVTLVMA
jgi:hypothetical protein